MNLYSLRIWWVPYGTSGGYNVTTIDDVRGAQDVFRILTDYKRQGRLLGRRFQLAAVSSDLDLAAEAVTR